MIRLVLAFCLAALLAVPAQALDLKNLDAADKAALQAEIRSYLLAHPEVLVEAMQALEAKQQRQQARNDTGMIQEHSKALFDDPASWVGGNPKGDVTLVEFMDYRCGYCRKAYSDVNALVKSDGNIRFVVKEYPILGPQSVVSARYAIAVLQNAGPDAYAKAHDALMTLRGEVTPIALDRISKTLGLDPAAMTRAMKSDRVSKVIEDNMALASALQIQGTPSFVISDRMLRGYLPLAEMRAMVKQIRAD